MQLCRVVGSTVSTVKAPGLADYKLLNVTPAAGAGPPARPATVGGGGRNPLSATTAPATGRPLPASTT